MDEDEDKIYYDKEEIKQYELTIKKASNLLRDDVKESIKAQLKRREREEEKWQKK